LQIKQGKNNGGSSTVNGIKREDLKLLNQDIRFIKTSPIHLVFSPKQFFGSGLMYLLYGLSLLAALGVWLWKRKETMEGNNVVQTKNKKALRLAAKKLAGAEKYLKANDEKQFYNEVQRSLWGYVSDKLNVSMADLSKDAITEQLMLKQVQQEQITELFGVIDDCEMVLYAPSAVAGKMKQNYLAATNVIVKIEQQLNS